MAADDDVLDAEVLDGVLDDGAGAEITGVHDVGDIAVDEDIAGLEAQHASLGASGVGATQPEDLRFLTGRESREEFGVIARGVGGPVFVQAEAIGVLVCSQASPVSLGIGGINSGTGGLVVFAGEGGRGREGRGARQG